MSTPLDTPISDSAQQILAPAQADPDAKAQAWEAYHNSPTSDALATAIGGINLPQEIKASLWEAKNAIPAARAAIAANPPAVQRPTNPIIADTSYQATPAESTSAGLAAAVKQREQAQPIVSAMGHTSIGAGKGIGSTATTAEGVGNRLLGATGMIDDQTFQNNMKNLQAQKEKLTPEGFSENVGFNLEGLAEWMVTAEVGGAALNATKKFSGLGDAAKWLIDNPVKARMLGNAAMAGTSTAATTASQGGTAGDIAKEGAIGAGVGAGAGLLGEGVAAGIGKVSGGVGSLLERMGYGGDVIDFVKSAAKEAPVRTPQEQSEALTTSLDAEESAMHDRFDKSLNDVRDSLAGKVLPMKDTPLYETAFKLKNRDASLPADLVEGLRSLTPNVGKVENTLDSILNDSDADAGVTGDYLIDLRRGLNRSIKSANPMLKPVISELLDGVDATLDNMDAGASTKYASARTDYKTTLASLKDSAVKTVRAGRQNNITDYLTVGGGSVAKVNALKTALGDSGPSQVMLLGAEKFAQIAQDSIDDAGNVDLNKFVSGWRKIPQGTREAMFNGVSGGNAFLDKLNDVVANAKTHSNIVKSIKIALPAAGAALTGLGLTSKDKTTWSTLETVLGLVTAVGGYAGAKPLVDFLASNPKLLRAMGGAAGIPLAVQGVSRAAQPVISHAAALAGATHVYSPENGGTLTPVVRDQH